jgi:putative MATE family efflux protein
MTNIVIGLSVGGTVVIAQYLGSNDRQGMRESISTLITFLLAAAVVLTVSMMLLSDKILHLIQTPRESYEQAKGYLNITLSGTIFIFGYNAFSAILRGLGDSRRPLIFVSTACGINVVLDFLFVGLFGMEAAGAALATVISQAVSMIACMVYLKRSGFDFDFRLRSFRFYPSRFVMLLKIGIPISIQNVITNFSFLVLTTIANSMGVIASAAVGIVGKYNGFAILPAIAVGSSVSAMVAQNMGAGLVDRAKKTFHTGFALAFSVTFVAFIITQLFPAQILSLFGDDPEMIAAGVEYIRTFSIDYIIVVYWRHTGVSRFPHTAGDTLRSSAGQRADRPGRRGAGSQLRRGDFAVHILYIRQMEEEHGGRETGRESDTVTGRRTGRE